MPLRRIHATYGRGKRRRFEDTIADTETLQSYRSGRESARGLIHPGTSLTSCPFVWHVFCGGVLNLAKHLKEFGIGHFLAGIRLLYIMERCIYEANSNTIRNNFSSGFSHAR